MKKLVLAAFVLFFTVASQAQSRSANSSEYKTALGVKVWDGGGISLKHFFDKNAGELIGYFYQYGIRFTGLYEIHKDIPNVRGLKWYVGPGVHISFYDGDYSFRDYFFADNHTNVGIDGVIGLDYKFSDAPINISLDWQPAFEFGDGPGFYGSWGGLGIRYTF